MNLTRKQLRKLIETTIKPTIPNVPSKEALGKIDNLARDKEMRPDADSLAGAFSYPEDRSYTDDLRTYDTANRVTFDSVKVGVHLFPTGKSSNEIVIVPIPYELVDTLIEEHEVVFGLKKSGEFLGSRASNSAWALRTAATNIFRHIHDYLDDKYGRVNYNVQAYGAEEASGYRADEYSKAMQRGG